VKGSVLILGSVPRIAIPVARSLHRYGISVDVATFSSIEASAHSRAIRDFVRVPNPDASPDAFATAVCELIRSGRHEMLIPGNDVALTAIMEHYDRFIGMVPVACPAPPIVERVLNKSITLEIASRCGLSVPKTRKVSHSNQIGGLGADLGFPFVLKPAKKSRSEEFKVLTIHNEAEVAKLFPVHRQFSDPLLAQEYCEGEGVGVEMLLCKGDCVASFQHRRLKEHPYSGGVSVLAVAETPDPALVQASATLLRELEWDGVAMVEFRVHPTGGAFLMEVNGRYWGTVSLPISCGVDFPFYQWQLLHGELPAAEPTHLLDQRWRWTAGYVRRLHGLLVAAKRPGRARDLLFRELRQLSTDFGGATSDSLWTMSDPAPAIREIVSTIQDLAVSDVRALFGGFSGYTPGNRRNIKRAETGASRL
jgi:predicted ATP-grasp superfamily ATP-dependent carboligase